MPKQAIGIPLFYHPSNVLFLDDEQTMLNSLCLSISEDIPYAAEEDPNVALDYLASHVYPPNAITRVVTENPDFFSYETSRASYILDFDGFQEGLDKPDRFKKVTVVTVDKHMKTMNGLEFCRQVRQQSFPVQLLLITGSADSDEAIEAFNNGLIDGFIPKADPDISVKVNRYVKQLMQLQFESLTEDLVGMLPNCDKLLSHSRFRAAFEKICQTYSIVEYYIADSSCSFLMLDKNGKAYHLIVRSEEDFENFVALAKNAKAPDAIVEALRKREKMPFSAKKKNVYLHLEGSNWNEHMLPVHRIVGPEVYYAVVECPDKKVFSFADYMGQVWPEP